MSKNREPDLKVHTACTQIRRMLVKHSTVSMNTGETRELGEEWVTRACGAPLFAEAEKHRGTCRMCFSGWVHPNNYPVMSQGSSSSMEPPSGHCGGEEREGAAHSKSQP